METAVAIPLNYLLGVLFGAGGLLVVTGIVILRAALQVEALLQRDEDTRKTLLKSPFREVEMRRLLARLSVVGVTLLGLGLGLFLEGGRRLYDHLNPVSRIATVLSDD